MIKLVENNASAGISEFQWGASEQKYPFEKDKSGNILYCKEIDLGVLPNSGNKIVSHGITGLTIGKIFRVEGYVNSGGSILQLALCRSDGYAYCVGLWANPTDITVTTSFNYGSYSWTALARIVYAK